MALAKALTAYAKVNPTFTFKAGMVEGRAIDIGAIGELASLPSREEMFGKLLFLIQAPAQRLATRRERGGPEPGRGCRPGLQGKQVFKLDRRPLSIHDLRSISEF